mmetsp:Transcript_23310/g.64401  ORF Transcript_23310/g.64401 Transcript_23310/m.64401 type:complete len:128 (+) Transcript_23310:33-416(+)
MYRWCWCCAFVAWQPPVLLGAIDITVFGTTPAFDTPASDISAFDTTACGRGTAFDMSAFDTTAFNTTACGGGTAFDASAFEITACGAGSGAAPLPLQPLALARLGPGTLQGMAGSHHPSSMVGDGQA